jgi:integrase
MAPNKVKWIKTANPRPRHRTAEELISREELKKLLDACQNERDRAFIMLLYEGGLRAGEMSVLKINSVSFSDDGMWIDIPDVPGVTKTGGRRIPLIEAEPFVKNWINVHTGRNNRENPLWTKLEQYDGNVKPMTYDSMRMMISKRAKAAGLNPDKFNLHNFRHTCATEKAAAGWSKAQMDMYFGWDPNSNTAATYIHMQSQDLLSAVRKLHGLPTSDTERIKQKIECQRCGKINDSDARFCSRCQIPLDLKVALEVSKERERYDKIMSKFMERLMENPAAKEILIGTIKEFGG